MNRSVLLIIIVLTSVATILYRTPTELETARFGSVSLKIEYAMTPEARERGLGGRREIRKGYGMLFVFPKADYYGFWMKDMLVPLDIFWLDDQGRVVSMSLHTATSSYPTVFYPTSPAHYVLETAAGFGEVASIATGTQLLLKKFPSVSK